MRYTKIFSAMLLGAGMIAFAGCSDDQGHMSNKQTMDNRPPPAAPVVPYQDQPGINHEERSPTLPPNSAAPMQNQ